MSTTPLLDNILGQPDSLSRVMHLNLLSAESGLKEAVALLHERNGRILITGMGASFFCLDAGFLCTRIIRTSSRIY